MWRAASCGPCNAVDVRTLDPDRIHQADGIVGEEFG
jgi:hypothetical protein